MKFYRKKKGKIDEKLTEEIAMIVIAVSAIMKYRY